MTTIAWLRRTLVEDYGIDPDILEEASVLEDLGIDSLGIMELFFKVEDAFRICVPHDQTPLVTLGDVGAYIDRLVGQQHAGADTASVPPDTAG